MRVLVVEDEFLVAMDVEAALTAHGHEVIGPASSIAQALEILEEDRPDVALLDFNLQGKPVSPVAERLRDLGVGMVLSSAYEPQQMNVVGALAEVECIQKPYGVIAMLEALTRAIVAEREEADEGEGPGQESAASGSSATGRD